VATFDRSSADQDCLTFDLRRQVFDLSLAHQMLVVVHQAPGPPLCSSLARPVKTGKPMPLAWHVNHRRALPGASISIAFSASTSHI
jgi:hypothetical protein